MVSIVDVSRKANVSVATVSRALHNPEKLRPATLERVRKAIAETGFRPNSLAQNFRTGRSNLIMVLVPDLTNVFFSRVIKGIEDKAAEAGYSVLIGNMALNRERARVHGDLVARRMAEGIINLAGEVPQNIAAMVHAQSIPMVFGCEWDENYALPSVRIDNCDSAYRMGQYLLSLGHRSFGLVTGPAHNQLTALRSKGFHKALAQAECPCDITFIAAGDYTSQSGYQAIAATPKANLPDAIFCFNDEMAYGVMRGLHEAGLSIPQDICVAGFDDLEASQFCTPSLTSVWQPAEDIGRRAMGLLHQLIKGEDITCDTVLLADIAIRESTGPKAR